MIGGPSVVTWIVAGLFLTALSSAVSAAETATDCDRLAGAPTDPKRVADGVGIFGVDAPPAISACEKALADHPDDPRLLYELGRAHAARAAQEKTEAGLGLAAQFYGAAAARSYPHAQIALAQLLWSGRGVRSDPTEALALIDKAMASDAIVAKGMRRGMFLQAALGSRDVDESGRLLVQDAAAKGNGDALYALAMRASRDANTKADAVVLLQKAADAGSSSALVGLAHRYYLGAGVEKDSAESARLLRKAAEGDDPRALYNVAMSYAYGNDGLAKDEREAAELFKRAADAGDEGALSMLSVFYAEHKGGFPRDWHESERLERLAADAGDENSVVAIAKEMALGLLGDPKTSKADAIAYLERAARWSDKAKQALIKMKEGHSP